MSLVGFWFAFPHLVKTDAVRFHNRRADCVKRRAAL